MPTALSARVVPEDGDAFDAPVANLTPSSLFLLTEAPLSYRQALSVKIGEISLHGEVALCCVEPPGALVSYRATAEALQELEDFMETLPVIVAGSPGVSLEDFKATSDEELDALPDGDPEGPTNTEGEPVEVDEEDDGADPSRDAAAEVRKAFNRSNFPPNLATERVGEDQIRAAQSAVLARRPGDRDPTVVPQLADLDAAMALDDQTESGVAQDKLLTADVAASARTDDVEPDEKTVVPKSPAEAKAEAAEGEDDPEA